MVWGGVLGVGLAVGALAILPQRRSARPENTCHHWTYSGYETIGPAQNHRTSGRFSFASFMKTGSNGGLCASD